MFHLDSQLSPKPAIFWGACGLLALAAAWIGLHGGLLPTAPHPYAHLLLLVDLWAVALPWTALYLLAAGGLGWPLRRWLLPAHPDGTLLQPALGLGLLMATSALFGWAGWLTPPLAWGLVGAGAGLQLLQALRFLASGTPWPVPAWPGLALAPPAGLLALAAACPPGALWAVEAFGYDVLTYHLQLPKAWLAEGRITLLPHNVYGTLPGWVEATTLHLATLTGSARGAVYPAQLLHAAVAVYAAILVGRTARRTTGSPWAMLAGAALLAVPWVLIVGSLAYNEMYTLALGAAALLILAGDRPTARGWAAAGALLGAATMAKLTAGPLMAAGLVLALLPRAKRPRERERARWARVAALGFAGFLVVCPWLIRNASWTGNPVFPFLAEHLGTGHWTPEQAARWERAHHPGDPWRGLEAAWDRWLTSPGYGALFAEPAERRATDVARFADAPGLPLFWIAVLLAGALALRRRRARHLTLAMSAALAVSLFAWLGLTHHQGRFLVYTLLPGALVFGLGMGEASAAAPRWRGLVATTGLAVIAGTLLTALSLLGTQAPWRRPEPGAPRRPLPLWMLVDTMHDPTRPPERQRGWVGAHPLNKLPREAKVLLVADVGSVFYLAPAVTWHTAFDRGPLGEAIRTHGPDPEAVTRQLTRAGHTHVWVGWAELARLKASYGYDPAVTAPALRRLAEAWQQLQTFPGATLYRLPAASPPSAAAEEEEEEEEKEEKAPKTPPASGPAPPPRAGGTIPPPPPRPITIPPDGRGPVVLLHASPAPEK